MMMSGLEAHCSPRELLGDGVVLM